VADLEAECQAAADRWRQAADPVTEAGRPAVGPHPVGLWQILGPGRAGRPGADLERWVAQVEQAVAEWGRLWSQHLADLGAALGQGAGMYRSPGGRPDPGAHP